jgi:hypothetical protein
MHTTHNDSHYYVFNTEEDTWTTYNTLDSLLYWVYTVDRRGYWYGRDWRNRFFGTDRPLKEFGHNPNDTYYDWVDKCLGTKRFLVKYVVYDSNRSVVSRNFLIDALDNFDYDAYYRKKWRRSYWPRYWGCHKPVFRRDPIPHTGGHRWCFSHYYRTKIRCTQEKRWAEAHQQMGIKVRGKRTKRYLPDPWDDIQRASARNKRSWKKVKKRKQWM